MESPLLSVSEALAGKRVLLTGSHRTSWARSPSPCCSTATGRSSGASGSWSARAARQRRRPVRREGRPERAVSAPARPPGSRGARRSPKRCSILDGDITDPLWAGRGASGRSTGRWTWSSTAPAWSLQPAARGGAEDQHLRGARTPSSSCLGWDVPLVHVSTAFVAGNRAAGVRGRGDRRLLPPQGRARRAGLLARGRARGLPSGWCRGCASRPRTRRSPPVPQGPSRG